MTKRDRERRLCERTQRPGAFLRAELTGLNKLGVIGDARGKGMLLGVAFAPLLRVSEEEEIEGIVSIFRDSLGEAFSD